MSFNSAVDQPRRTGTLVVFVCFGLFGGWSLLAPLQEAALAPGKVILEGNRKTIQHLEGGIVREILVAEGAQVDEGDLLIKLDDTQTRAQLDIALGQFYAVKARETRLRSERDNKAAAEYPESLTGAQDPRSRDAMAGQDQVLIARRVAHRGEVEVLEQRIQQLQAQAEGLQSLRYSKQALHQSYEEEVADFEALLEEGYTEKTRLRELQRNEARLEGEIAELGSSIAQVEMAAGETRLEILQLQKEFHTHVVDELGEVQVEAYDLEERVRALQDRYDQTRITSPVSGKVLGLSVHTIGGVIGGGEPLMYIVPGRENLIVEARVKPEDIDRVENGQAADIRFTAFSAQNTPVIEGEVRTVSADALTDENTGESYFLAQVSVTETGQAMLEDRVLVPGMPAEVLIQTGSRTLFQYMAQPISNTFARSMIER